MDSNIKCSWVKNPPIIKNIEFKIDGKTVVIEPPASASASVSVSASVSASASVSVVNTK